MDRTVLPIPQPTYPPITTFDARNATPPPRFEVKAPAEAPNVLIILLDDTGFGQSSAFGGPVSMPTIDALAREGLRYNQFHTAALCSPTRVALLTGRNHHPNNVGAIAELATASPGNTGVRPHSIATIAEMLRLNGYSTASGTRHRPGKSALRARPICGRPVRASTNSTVLLPVRPINIRRRSTRTCRGSKSRPIPITS